MSISLYSLPNYALSLALVRGSFFPILCSLISGSPGAEPIPQLFLLSSYLTAHTFLISSITTIDTKNFKMTERKHDTPPFLNNSDVLSPHPSFSLHKTIYSCLFHSSLRNSDLLDWAHPLWRLSLHLRFSSLPLLRFLLRTLTIHTLPPYLHIELSSLCFR